MVTELFLNIIYYIVSLLLTPFQSISFPVGTLAGFLELIAYASIFVPLSALGVCLGIWLALQFATFTMSVINWIIGKIPTIS